MGRYYKHAGIDKPSVTTICGQLDKPALTYWAANCACDYIIDKLQTITNPELPDHPAGSLVRMDDLLPIVESARKGFRSVSKTALDTGSRVHDAIEQYLNTGHEPFKPRAEVEAGFLAFLEWQDKHKFKSIATEQTVYGDRFAGQCDLICELDGKQYLVDFKTTNISEDSSAYPEHRYQVAAYRSCVPGVEGCGILYLHKQTGQPNWRDSSATYEADLNVFNILVDLWYASHPNVSKRIIRQKEAA